jgi:hypothetical protein
LPYGYLIFIRPYKAYIDVVGATRLILIQKWKLLIFLGLCW